MVQSAGVPQLSDNQAPPGRPSSATETEVDLIHNTQAPPPPKESGPNKRRKARVRGNSTRPKKRMTDSRGVSDRPLVEKQGVCDEGSPLPPLLRISLKSLLAAEMKLVYGDEQHNITQQPSKSPVTSSASQFMCQASEIVGPPSGPNLGFLPQIDKWLDVALQDADSYYQQKKYGIAASRFTTALELCSKGAAVEQSLHAVYEDISKVASLIESRLVACYLRLKRPKIALNHSHRAIQLNPIYFRHHLRQAMVYRLLGNPCAAARSAMIADWVYWLSGGSDEHISKLIKLYWQALLDEAITMEDRFSVMYTPCSAGDSVGDCIAKAEETFRKQHTAFTDYLFTDPSGGHLLPQTTDWSNPPSTQQKYVLTLGFRRGQDGSFLSKLTSRTCPSFTGPRASFSSSSPEDMERVCDTFSRRILPVLDFIKCTKLAAGFSPGSGLVERLQYAGYLGQIQRSREQTVILHQALAELAVAPYLQDLSHADTSLLQALMADTMDTLEGRRTDRERVWNEMQKVGMLEDLLFQLEETYLKNKAQRASRKQRVGVQGAEGKARGRPKAGVKIGAKGGGTVVTDKAKVRPTETQQETAVAPMTLPDP
ncbi:spermatogenesis-associated protein 16-like [Salvelinus namaycush]|uniref:Spermatogenesis-associated protein 16-like n=1 Tax=Salvelinus namaycush TaxID=8040 RepID=A0A8U1BRH1_SALNM|nr:spermatogenesis-associated protein 16-like [Salvelinus namaycush]